MDRILIIDDDEFVRTGLAADLRHGGFDVETVASGDEGLAAIAGRRPDLVLLDVLLDKDDGIEVLQSIRKRCARLPVVMITGNASMDSTLGALRTGANDFFLKPIEPMELVYRARRVIDAERDRVLAEEAERAQDKLQSLQTLAGGIAHDLNNQLTVILGSVQELARELQDGTAKHQMIQGIQQSGSVIAGLADKLLTYSGGGLFEVESVDLAEYLPARIRAMSEELKATLDSRTEVEIRADPAKLPAAVDCQQLDGVIEGLLYNAFEAIHGENGKVTIELAARAVDRALALVEPKLSDLKPGTYARIRVSDNGNGMPPETMHNVFDPFFTTKFTGRGMGLPSALGVIRAHQGQLMISSKVGEGTAVEFYLPLQEPVQAQRASPRRFDRVEADDAPVSGHVLIVDDEEPIRKMAVRVVEKAGLDVTEAEGGAEALAQLTASPDDFDLVVLDLTMPGMDGVEALREIRKIREDVQVLLVSGYHSKDVIARFVNEQPDAFMQKPFDVGVLRQKVRSMVRKAKANSG